MTPNIFIYKNSIWVSKNETFYVNFGSVAKGAKNSYEKSDRKMEFFTFVFVCKSFWTITLLG
jgi:hypothetical protein